MSGLADHLALHVLFRGFPPESIDRVLLETGRIEQRRRLLSARTTVYYVLAMALFPGAPYEAVARRLFEAEVWGGRRAEPERLPSKSAIFKARERLGIEPVRVLFHRDLADLRERGSIELSLHRKPVVVANHDRFAVSGGSVTRASVDTVEVSALRVLGVSIPHSPALLGGDIEADDGSGKSALASRVLRGLPSGVVCLAEMDAVDLQAWPAGIAAGADLLWGTRGPLPLRVREPLDDGSYLAEIGRTGREAASTTTLRVVELRRETRTNASGTGVDRLLTSLLDPTVAPSTELVGLYTRRFTARPLLWPLRPEPDHRPLELRSRRSDGVLQEAFAHLCAHQAISRSTFAPFGTASSQAPPS